MSQQPTTVFLAVRGQELLGFACYDTTAKGFFGPTGVDEQARGQGIGEALLIVTLKAMREAGYAYGVIGDPGPVAFYTKRLDALEIPKSKPGHYAGMLYTKPEIG
jgi:GNAT superfamily N-acetyltransferase